MMLFKALDMFIRTNIMIVIIYILSTETPYHKYIAVLGFLGIFWIILPIIEMIPIKENEE